MDVIFDIFRHAEISVKKEALVNCLTDPLDRRSTFRHVDVMVYIWVGGKYACVGLTRVSPIVSLGVGPFTVGHEALKVASSKVVKHEKVCSNNQHSFIQFDFETFDFHAPEVIDLLHKVQMVLHNNVMTLMSMSVVFTVIGFAIQKGLATQFVVCLPSIHV